MSKTAALVAAIMFSLVACDQASEREQAQSEPQPVSAQADHSNAVPMPHQGSSAMMFTTTGQSRTDQEHRACETSSIPDGTRFTVGGFEIRLPDPSILPELKREPVEIPINRGRVAHSEPTEETTLDPCEPFVPYTGTWGIDGEVAVEAFPMSSDAGEVCWLEIWGADLIAGEFGEQTGFPVKVQFGDPLNLLYETRIENDALTQRIIHTLTGEVLYESYWTDHQPWSGPNA